jgi:hypothetical protein
MNDSPDRNKSEELRDLLLQTYLEVQEEHETRRGTRLNNSLVTRYRRTFEFISAVQLGFLVACLSVFIEFVIIRLILHLDI